MPKTPRQAKPKSASRRPSAFTSKARKVAATRSPKKNATKAASPKARTGSSTESKKKAGSVVGRFRRRMSQDLRAGVKSIARINDAIKTAVKKDVRVLEKKGNAFMGFPPKPNPFAERVMDISTDSSSRLFDDCTAYQQPGYIRRNLADWETRLKPALFPLFFELNPRFYGCLLGQCIGDALGVTFEFKKASTIVKMLPGNCDPALPTGLQITGGGPPWWPVRMVPGQVTDDGELALGCANAWLRGGCTWNDHQQSAVCLRWFNSVPFDCGVTTANAFSGATDWASIRANVIERNQSSLSNGALMRISPVALGTFNKGDVDMWYLSRNGKPEDMAKMKAHSHKINAMSSKIYTMITHAVHLTHENQEVVDCCISYIRGIHLALAGYSVDDIFRCLMYASQPFSQNLLQQAFDAVQSGEPFVPRNPLGDKAKLCVDENPKGKPGMGYMAVAFALAFYVLLKFKTFWEAMVYIIQQGGDTDTNCAIAGALFGAHVGSDKLPQTWVETVTRCRNPRVAVYAEANQQYLDEMARAFTIRSLIQLPDGRYERNA